MYLFTTLISVTNLQYNFTFCEALLEAMMFSDPTKRMSSSSMLQIFSLELAKIPGNDGLVELYGYIAARDDVDKLLNYVINISRDDPIIVEQVHIHTYVQLFQGISLS